MILLVSHIIIASLSIVSSAVAFFIPSKLKLHVTYALVALTFISGTFLVIETPEHMTQICITGIIYSFIVLSSIVATRHKLSSIKSS